MWEEFPSRRVRISINCETRRPITPIVSRAFRRARLEFAPVVQPLAGSSGGDVLQLPLSKWDDVARFRSRLSNGSANVLRESCFLRMKRKAGESVRMVTWRISLENATREKRSAAHGRRSASLRRANEVFTVVLSPTAGTPCVTANWLPLI